MVSKNDSDYFQQFRKGYSDENDDSDDSESAPKRFKNEHQPSKNTVKEKKQTSSKKSFAEKYLLKHGYEKGKGLGKYQDGIIEPIKASQQKGNRGLGYSDAAELLNAASNYVKELDDAPIDEIKEWLHNDHEETFKKDLLKSWVKSGPPIKTMKEIEFMFCDSAVVNGVMKAKILLDQITEKDLKSLRSRSNPYESIDRAIFLNRAAMKMANMDAILDRMFTNPKNPKGVEMVGSDDLLYFADVCAGPGGFSEYVLFRKKWRAKGFGFTLCDSNDFKLNEFWAGSPETFEPYYGKATDGNVYNPENLSSLRDHILEYTDGKGVHFMMADGGMPIPDNQLNDQELICKKLYLCQCLTALQVVRPDGNFVVKLFDIFTNFSISLVYLMYRSFRRIMILKPNTSRPASSERYLVCKWKREDCIDIADHLFEVNEKLPMFGSEGDDVLELVPVNILKEDVNFYEYITSSNNKLGKKQILNLYKLLAFSQDSNMKEERQYMLRKECLTKWDIPDKARTEPKKCDASSKCNEILKCNTPDFPEKNNLENQNDFFTSFSPEVLSHHDWYGVIVSEDKTIRANNTCAFYLGCGRGNVFMYVSNKWVSWNANKDFKGLCLPDGTLVYGELLNEYRGEGSGQIRSIAFHIIDGYSLGSEDISKLQYEKRIEACRLFAKSLTNSKFVVRVKEYFPLREIKLLFNKMTEKPIKSSSNRHLCVHVDNKTFWKAGGVIFFRDTKDLWHRGWSKTYKAFYFHNEESKKSLYYCASSGHEIFADFAYTFSNRHIWMWSQESIEEYVCKGKDSLIGRTELKLRNLISKGQK